MNLELATNIRRNVKYLLSVIDERESEQAHDIALQIDDLAAQIEFNENAKKIEKSKL